MDAPEPTCALTDRMYQVLAIRERRKDERGGKGATLRQMGDELGLSAERTRQLIVISERRLRLQALRRDRVQHDEHVQLWRRLWIGTLEMIRKTCRARRNRRTYATMWRPNNADRAVIDKLPLLGPFNTLPRFKKQGPIRPFHMTPLFLSQRQHAIEWFMRGGWTREQAAAHFDSANRDLY